MSLFGGLDDGVVESIPTLIDEDLENLFAGEALVLTNKPCFLNIHTFSGIRYFVEKL